MLAAAVATVGAVVMAVATPLFADAPGVTAVAPFVGQYRDNFNSYAESAYGQLSILSGMGHLDIEGDSNSIKIEYSSSLGGDLVTPISVKMMGQLGILDWDFYQPIKKFGGYWENNSHADDATIEFTDYLGNAVGSLNVSVPVAGQHWVWNGWQFDTPITHMRVTGNGLINGFIWYDNIEVTPAPEPACGALVLLSSAALLGRARRKQK